MATDGWQRTKDLVVKLWSRHDATESEAIGRELDAAQEIVVAAHEEDDSEAANAVTAIWQLRFRELVRTDPALAEELRRVLNDELLPVLEPEERSRVGSIVMRANASDNARVYQSARDMTINEK